MQRTRLLHLAAIGAALPCLAGAAGAQAVTLSGNVYDGAGGPLASGTIYHSTAGFTVPVGETLTIPGDVIIKLSGTVQVAGDLDVLASAGQPSYFTSKQDDSLGGDTFADGATVGAPGQWGGVVVQATGSVNVHHAELRFAGAGGWRAIYGSGGTIGLYDSVIRDSAGPGIDLNQFDVPTVIERCAIDDNDGWAIDEAPITRIPSFLDNTASGNGGDAVRAFAPTASADLTINPENLVNGVLVPTSGLTVASGATLTLGAGVCVKVLAGGVKANGTLRALGTSSDPVVFTALEDDDHHGDTENDGPTSGVAGAWDGVQAHPGGLVELTYATVRHAGNGGWRGIYGAGGAISLYDCTIRDGAGPGIDLNQHDVPTVIERCAILDNGGWAIDEAPIARIPSFLDNTASGNASGDAVRALSPTASIDVTINPENLIDSVFVPTSGLTVANGATLTLGAGVCVKFGTGGVKAHGTLRALGSASDPVIFTALEDDDHHGDTENDGPTSGAPGAWDGVQAHPGGSVELTHATVRHAGNGGWRAVYGAGGAIDLLSCEVLDSAGAGIDLNSHDVAVSIVDCDIDDNTGVAIDEVPVHLLSGFDSNRAQGNADGDYVLVDGQTLVANATVGPRNLINGALVVNNTITVPSGTSLTLLPGTVIKWKLGLLRASGTLIAVGTGLEPIVLTAFEDDTVAGDTNGDGASVGAPGAWNGVQVTGTATGTRLAHVVSRFAGSGNYEGLRTEAGAQILELDSVRAERCFEDGFQLASAPAVATNLVAFANGGDGIKADVATVLVHATSAANGGIGIRTVVGGTATSSISWGNAVNFSGYGAGDLVACDGDPVSAGSSGNVFVDPQFEDVANGDLRLAPGSPLVDAADLATALGLPTDAVDGSRIVLTASGGPVAPDMGAYEQVRWTLGQSGSPAIGETLVLQVDGPSGLALYGWGTLDGSLFLSPYGFLLCGTFSVKQLGPGGAVGAPYPIPVPNNPLIVGVTLGFQGFGLDPLDPGTAHLTNVSRVVIEPALP